METIQHNDRPDFLSPKSVLIKLTEYGLNRRVFLPSELDVYRGEMMLKSYAVHLDNTNTTLTDININIRGINHTQTANMNGDFLSIPLDTNGTRSTIEYCDMMLSVNGNRLPSTLSYDLLDSSYSPLFSTHPKPVCVFLYLSYTASSI